MRSETIWKLYGFVSLIIVFGIVGDFITIWAYGWSTGSWAVLMVLNSKGEGMPELLSLLIPLPWLARSFWKLMPG